MAPPKFCSTCNSPVAKLCKGCNSARYCSPECQQTDWPTHKTICSKFQDFKATRTDAAHWLAIVFLEDATSPELKWIKCLRKHSCNKWYDDPQLNDIIGDRPKWAKIFTMNPLRKRTLDGSIVLWHREDFLMDGSTPNKALYRATGGQLRHDWRGPTVALHLTAGTELCEDVTAADLRDIVDCFLGAPKGVKTTECYSMDLDTFMSKRDLQPTYSAEAPELASKAKGVRLACWGDMEDNHASKCTVVEVTDDHPVWKLGDESQISRLVGCPVLVWKCPPPKKWLDRVEARNNQAAAFLFLDVKAKFLCLSEEKWRDPAGSVIMVRKDKEPLTVIEAEILCEFCGTHIQSKIEMCDGPEDLATVIPYITPEEYHKYRENYKRGMDDAENGRYGGSAWIP